MMLPIHERMKCPRSLARALQSRRWGKLRQLGEGFLIIGSALLCVAAMWALIG